MRIAIRHGMDIPLAGAPAQTLGESRPVGFAALLGSDYPGVRPDFRVAVGDLVGRGQTLFVDRKRPHIAFTAPVSGTVVAITRGARRMLDAIVLRVGTQSPKQFDLPDPRDHAGLRALLLDSGLWTSFRTRPFDHIPDPEAGPAAIFVTAIDTAPLAADPAVVIAAHQAAFQAGVEALGRLTDGTVFVCQAPGTPRCPASDRVNIAEFSGPHPAGLPGTHIHHLMPASAARSVWHLGYQDVIAIGHLLATGELWDERIVALAGPAALNPRLLAVPPGADLDELTGPADIAPDAAILSGSVLHGRSGRFLGRYHTQVTALRAPSSESSRLRDLGRWLLRRRPHDAILPVTAYERVMPLDILPVPLLRALSVGDVETAEALGCLELAEEDLALLSYVCPTGTDYAPLLRHALDEIGGAA